LTLVCLGILHNIQRSYHSTYFTLFSGIEKRLTSLKRSIMGLVGISTRSRTSRSWTYLRFILSMHPKPQEPLGTNTNLLTALLFQHPFLSIDLELGQDLNFHSIFAYRCLQVPTTRLFDHARVHPCLQYLDRVFCHLLVQPA
jgi:hypothetical protein